MPESIALSPGYKFAVLALPELRAKQTHGALVTAGDLSASVVLPVGSLDTWHDSIGALHQSELEETPLFLWATMPSAAPEVLDDENEQLQSRVYQFYLGLLIAVPYLSSGRLTSLTGGNADGIARVRSLTTYSRTWFTLGAPTPKLTGSRIQVAATLAAAIAKHDHRYGQSRFTRILRTFREATESAYLEGRLHQFVRCAEGLAVPPLKGSGKQFARRLSRVCAGPARLVLEQLYTIRGGVEHLHGPYARLPKMSKRRRWERVLVRTVQAEALARYLLLTYLTNEALWAHFQERSQVDAFWELSPKAFRTLWPHRIAFPEIAKGFDYAALVGHDHDT